MNAINKWLLFAQEDLSMAEAALEREIYNQVCFHSHQGIEKILKGFLHHKKRAIPKTHSLTELLSICKNIDGDFDELENTFIKIEKYYIPTRYPDALPGMGPDGLPTQNDAKEALKILQNTVSWIKDRLV